MSCFSATQIDVTEAVVAQRKLQLAHAQLAEEKVMSVESYLNIRSTCHQHVDANSDVTRSYVWLEEIL